MRKEKHDKEGKHTRNKHVEIQSTQIIKALRKRRKTKIAKKIICMFLVLIIISSIVFIKKQQENNNKIAKDNEEIRNAVIEESETDSRIDKVKELQKENSDIVGWLEVIGTDISYPVLQGEDNSYYMNHNYKKEKSTDGSLFLDKDYDWDKPSTNLLVYGHNNRGSEEMFVDLLNYKEENFYKEHQNIRFTTATEDAEYEIISVFLSRVYYKHETDVFRYYFFIDADNEEEFNDYVENSKKASLYEIEATAQYGDQLLTLSTCEYSQEDGRFAVVARKK